MIIHYFDMADFGVANFYLTTKLNQRMLTHFPAANPNECYLFYRNSTKRLADETETNYFICKGCSVFTRSGCARISVREGRIVGNPEMNHHPLCFPYPKATVEAEQLIKEARQNCVSGKRPLPAFQEALTKIPQRFPNQGEQEDVELQIGHYKKHRSSLYK